MGPTVSQPVSQHTCRLYNREISMCLCVGGITELYKAKNTESGETTEQQKYTKKMIHTECSDKKYVIWIVFGAVSLSISFSSFSCSLSFTWTPPFFRLSHLSPSAFNIGVSHFPALFRSFLAFWGYFRVWNIENFHIFFLLWRLPLLCASHDFSLGYFLFHFLFQYIIIAINFFRSRSLSRCFSFPFSHWLQTIFPGKRIYLRIKCEQHGKWFHWYYAGIQFTRYFFNFFQL